MVQLKSGASTGTRPNHIALRICALAFRRGAPASCRRRGVRANRRPLQNMDGVGQDDFILEAVHAAKPKFRCSTTPAAIRKVSCAGSSASLCLRDITASRSARTFSS